MIWSSGIGTVKQICFSYKPSWTKQFVLIDAAVSVLYPRFNGPQGYDDAGTSISIQHGLVIYNRKYAITYGEENGDMHVIFILQSLRWWINSRYWPKMQASGIFSHASSCLPGTLSQNRLQKVFLLPVCQSAGRSWPGTWPQPQPSSLSSPHCPNAPKQLSLPPPPLFFLLSWCPP